MSTLTPAAVRRQIASGTPDAIYLLQGEDEVEKSPLAAAFTALVDEGLRAFNVERIDEGEMTTGEPHDEVEKSALAAEFAALVDEGLRAFNVERIHVGDLTTGDRLEDGVASIVVAARTLP